MHAFKSSCVVVVVVAGVGGGNDFQWCFSQVKGSIEEDVAEGKYWFALVLNTLG